MRIYISLAVIFLLCGIVIAGNLPEPSPFKDMPIEQWNYLKEIARNFNNLTVVKTNPDGARTGKYGDMVLFNNSGTYYLEICVSSPTGTVWRGCALTDIP